jgi:hypothetical protein
MTDTRIDSPPVNEDTDNMLPPERVEKLQAWAAAELDIAEVWLHGNRISGGDEFTAISLIIGVRRMYRLILSSLTN